MTSITVRWLESEAVRNIAEHVPLGILSLAGVLEREGLAPEIVDLNRLHYDWLRSEEQQRGEIDLTAYAARRFAPRSLRLQKVIYKGLDLQEAADRIRDCDKFEIKTAVSLITGFPEETPEDLRDTVAFFMDSMRYDWADPQLCILAPLADTPIYKQHKEELVFDDVISDMSFQGWRQDPEDVKMIGAHAEIFPNFYSVPTPHLDRQFIKELREFILSGMQVLRWLLVGLHQDSGDLLVVFRKWREWRYSHKGPLPGNNERVYYAHPHFIASSSSSCVNTGSRCEARRRWQSLLWPTTKQVSERLIQRQKAGTNGQ